MLLYKAFIYGDSYRRHTQHQEPPSTPPTYVNQAIEPGPKPQGVIMANVAKRSTPSDYEYVDDQRVPVSESSQYDEIPAADGQYEGLTGQV